MNLTEQDIKINNNYLSIFKVNKIFRFFIFWFTLEYQLYDPKYNPDYRQCVENDQDFYIIISEIMRYFHFFIDKDIALMLKNTEYALPMFRFKLTTDGEDDIKNFFLSAPVVDKLLEKLFIDIDTKPVLIAVLYYFFQILKDHDLTSGNYHTLKVNPLKDAFKLNSIYKGLILLRSDAKTANIVASTRGGKAVNQKKRDYLKERQDNIKKRLKARYKPGDKADKREVMNQVVKWDYEYCTKTIKYNLKTYQCEFSELENKFKLKRKGVNLVRSPPGQMWLKFLKEQKIFTLI